MSSVNPARVATAADITKRTPRGLKVLRICGLIALGALIGVTALWATATILAPPKAAVVSRTSTYVKVSNGTVGSFIALSTSAEWFAAPTANNAASGVVTSVDITPGSTVDAGSQIFSVNLRPVVVAEGSIPSFRPISFGDVGNDVAQLQHLLATLRYYRGPISGRFDGATTSAVRSWQKFHGLTPDGVVQPGDVVYLPTLPATVSLDSDHVAVGARIDAGVPAVRTLGAEPTFEISSSPDQSALIPEGAKVTIAAPDGSDWIAAVGARQSPSADEVTLNLIKVGESICGGSCKLVPVDKKLLLPSNVIIQENVSGLVVPTAAVKSSVDGSTVLVDASSRRLHVRILASAKGMSVVSGNTIHVGLRVRIPAGPGE